MKLKTAHNLISYSIIFWFILFTTFIIRARFILGHWPYPYHPDPKDLQTWHYVFTIFLLLAFWGITPLWFAFTIYLKTKVPNIKLKTNIIVFATSLITLLIIIIFDTGSYIGWLLD